MVKKSKQKNRSNAVASNARVSSTEELTSEPLGKEELDLLETAKKSALGRIKGKKAKSREKELKSRDNELEDDPLSEEELALQEKEEADVREEIVSKGDDVPPVRNDTALKESLECIKQNTPFVETLCVTSKTKLEVKDVEDDLNREMMFYNQALIAVKDARAQLDKIGVIHMRPDDYFGDMVKTDRHMGRVKQNLLFEKQKIERFEKRKAEKDYKKYSKELQAVKQKEKGELKLKAKNLAQEYKEKTPDNIESVLGKKRKQDSSQTSGAAPFKSRKRQAKDKKFGFGGKKRSSKRNSSQSTNDTAGFNVKKNKAPFPGMKKQRPGKARRTKSRS